MGSHVNWPDYHKKRQHEIETFLKRAKEAVSAIGPPFPEPKPEGERGRGRPPHSPQGMLLANLLRMQLKLSYWDMESLLHSNAQLREQLGLRKVPGRDTIHRHAQALREEYLVRFNQALTAHLKKTSYASQSTPPVSRSRGTRDVGALPRTRNAAPALNG